MYKTSLLFLAFAATGVAAPAHAQLLGGGNATGGIGGRLGPVGGTLDGSFDAQGMIERDGSRIDTLRERTQSRSARLRERARQTAQGTADKVGSTTTTLGATAQGAASAGVEPGQQLGSTAATAAANGAASAQGSLANERRMAPFQSGGNAAPRASAATSALAGNAAASAAAARSRLPAASAGGNANANGSGSASASQEDGLRVDAAGSADGDAKIERGRAKTAPIDSGRTPPAATERERADGRSPRR